MDNKENDTKATLELKKYKKDRMLKYIAKQYNVNYSYLWQVSTLNKKPSRDMIDKLKDIISVDKWFEGV